jgi:hypothetical protein
MVDGLLQGLCQCFAGVLGMAHRRGTDRAAAIHRQGDQRPDRLPVIARHEKRQPGHADFPGAAWTGAETTGSLPGWCHGDVCSISMLPEWTAFASDRSAQALAVPGSEGLMLN